MAREISDVGGWTETRSEDRQTFFPLRSSRMLQEKSAVIREHKYERTGATEFTSKNTQQFWGLGCMSDGSKSRT